MDFAPPPVIPDNVPTLNVWVIYDDPLDYPDRFVVRSQAVLPQGEVVHGEVRLASSLQQARGYVPEELMRLDRDPHDDAKIVEVWL